MHDVVGEVGMTRVAAAVDDADGDALARISPAACSAAAPIASGRCRVEELQPLVGKHVVRDDPLLTAACIVATLPYTSASGTLFIGCVTSPRLRSAATWRRRRHRIEARDAARQHGAVVGGEQARESGLRDGR